MNKLKWILLMTLFLTACSRPAQTEVPELLDPVGVVMDTATVTRKDISRSYLYTGYVQPNVEEVWFTMSGELDQIYVSYGDHVQKGDVLATLDQKDLEKEVSALRREIEHEKQINAFTNEQLEQALASSQASLNELYANGVTGTSRQLASLDVEEKELALAQAQESQELSISQKEARLERLEQEVGSNQIVAPCNGSIVYVNETAKEGKMLNAYTTLFCVTDEDTIYAITDPVSDSRLNEMDALQATIGDQTYQLKHEPYPSDEVLSMVLSSNVHSRFKILDADEQVHEGDFVALYMDTQTKEDVLTIPVNALLKDEASRYVYQIVDGKRVRKNVEVGLITEIEAEIISGLEEGDEVYVQE